MEHVAGEDAVGLRAEDWAQVGPARRGAGSMPAALRIFQTVEAPIG